MPMYRIAPKPFCEAPGCQKTKAMGCGKYCHEHRSLDPGFQRKEAKRVAKGTADKLRLLPNSNSNKSGYKTQDDKLVDNAAAKEFRSLKKFFEDAAVELQQNPFCAECNARIPANYFRSATAHLLPKRKEYGFPSIATHPRNRMFLGAAFAGCGCHDKYDSSWETASTMLIWPVAVEIIVVELYPKINPAEHKNIPDILWIEIEKIHGKRV